MKIGISGAANCGKTTTAWALSKELNLPIVAEGFASFIQARRTTSDPMALLQLHVDIIDSKKASERQMPDGFVADRTAIDVMMLFCAIPNPIRLKMSHQAVTAFVEKARESCQDYEALVVPPWGAVSYQRPNDWSPATGIPTMNPWSNFSRHMTVLGIAEHWLGREKVLTPPKEVVLNGNIGQWLKEKMGDLSC